MNTTLLIMAAGIGSRFGTGIKQLEPVDDAGHIIMDYSIHDAIEAGFNHVVFIIRKDIEKEFKEVIGDRIASICSSHNVTVDYAFQDKEAILSTAAALDLSKASVTSYLPYEKGVYFPRTADKEKISVGAERQRRYRAVRKLRTEPTEEHLWEVVLLYSGVRFKTYSGLPFTYEIKNIYDGNEEKISSKNKEKIFG